MFEKVLENQRENKYTKIYKTTEKYDTIDIINKLQQNNINITNVYVVEDADLGMKSFEGNYSLNDFMLLYSRINKNDMASLVLYLENENKIYLGSGEYISLLSKNNIELNDLLEKSKRL